MASVASLPALGRGRRSASAARAGHMRPGQPPAPAHAGLVVVQHRRLRQRRLDALPPPAPAPPRLPHPRHQRAPSQRHPEQVREQLLHPAQWDQLLLQQIDRQRPHPRPILRAARRLRRKRADAHRLARRAAHVQRLMFGDYQPDRAAGPAPAAAPAAPPPPRPAAPGTARRRPADAPPPRRGSPPDAASPRDAPVARPASCRCVAADSSSCAPARHSTAACRCCGCPWPAALAARCSAPLARYSASQLLDLRHQLGDLCFQGGVFFVKRHAPMLLPQRKSA